MQIVVLEVPGRKLSTLPVKFESLSVSIRPGGAEVAVGSVSALSCEGCGGVEVQMYEGKGDKMCGGKKD